MSKNKKSNSKAKANAKNKLVTPVVNESTEKVEDIVVTDKPELEEQVVPVDDTSKNTVEKSKKNKAVEVKAKDINKKEKKKEKKPNKVVKSLKNTGNELKKVTWPKFKDVVKQTGVVLVFIIVFAVVLFGIDRLCSLLTGLLY